MNTSADTLPTLEILISSLGAEGLARTAQMHLPALPGVSYLISLQCPGGTHPAIPPALQRDDLRVVYQHSIGISHNRNAALACARGEILLISDDDLNYFADGLLAIRRLFSANPGLDFATFKHVGGDRKQYPAEAFSFDSKPPKGYYLTAFELALRRSALPADQRFSPDFGPGAPEFMANEEGIFLIDMLRCGLRGRFEPTVIVEHPGVTTGVRPATVGVLRAQGATFRYQYGTFWGLLHVLRDFPRRPAPPLKSLVEMLRGFAHARRLRTNKGS